jgi:hypothetical protein
MDGTRKRARPRKRWRDVVAEDLNIMGIKNSQAMARDRRKWTKNLLEAKKPRLTTDCSASGGAGGGGGRGGEEEETIEINRLTTVCNFQRGPQNSHDN